MGRIFGTGGRILRTCYLRTTEANEKARISQNRKVALRRVVRYSREYEDA